MKEEIDARQHRKGQATVIQDPVAEDGGDLKTFRNIHQISVPSDEMCYFCLKNFLPAV